MVGIRLIINKYRYITIKILIKVSELKQTPSTSNMDIDKSANLNNDTKEDHDRNNLAFLQLITLCKSYRDYLNTKNETSNPCDESGIGILGSFLLIIWT